MQQENAFKNKQKYTSPEDTELKSGHRLLFEMNQKKVFQRIYEKCHA
jgi:hypothetical protein